MAEKSRFNGTGRRKSSVARVTLTSPGKGIIEVNGVSLDNYVPRESLATIAIYYSIRVNRLTLLLVQFSENCHPPPLKACGL